MGRRKLKFDVRKNYERKRNSKLNVRKPLELTKQFVVSLPLCSYTHAPATSGQSLCRRLQRCKLPPHWSEATIDNQYTVMHRAVNAPSVVLYTVKCLRPPFSAEVIYTLIIHNDLTWSLNLGSLPVDQQPHSLAAPRRLLSVAEVLSLLSTLDSVKLCKGNPEEAYLKLVEKKGSLKDMTGIVHNSIILNSTRCMKIHDNIISY